MGDDKAAVVAAPQVIPALARLGVILFAFMHVMSYQYYYYSLQCNMVANVFRVMERMGRPAFTTQYFSDLLLEDSFHYVLYSWIAIGQLPSFMFLVPPTIFAFFGLLKFIQDLHAVPSTKKYISENIVKISANLRNKYAEKSYQFAARAEVGLTFVIFATILASPNVSKLMSLLMYCQFSIMRCISRRNARPRQAWINLRIWCETMVAHPRCPGIVRTGYYQFTEGIVDRAFRSMTAEQVVQ
eukprot:m.24337 g.24337  ORF g.24337 m.24337 type:complete len:242 (-) comp7599_c0_seq1:213-938(-)